MFIISSFIFLFSLDKKELFNIISEKKLGKELISFIKDLIVYNIDLKLFSFGLRLNII